MSPVRHVGEQPYSPTVKERRAVQRRFPVRGHLVWALIAVLAGVSVGVSVVSAFYGGRIVSGVSVASVPVGNLTPDQAALRLQERLDAITGGGIVVQLGDASEIIYPDSVGLDMNIQEAVEQAFRRGHDGSWWRRSSERITALWKDSVVPAPVRLDTTLLNDRVEDLGQISDVARKDLRLSVNGSRVTILTDSRPGKVVDRERAMAALTAHLGDLRTDPLTLDLLDDLPRATMQSAQDAQAQAERMLVRPVYLSFEDLQFSIAPAVLGTWLVNEYESDRLTVVVDRKAVGQYVTLVAEQLNIAPEPAQVSTQDGRITGFTPPKYGRAVQEDRTVELILAVLDKRSRELKGGDVITVPMRQAVPPQIGLGDGSGITELIGEATTPFTGSPKNRISNIKNGVRFLSGQVIQPGAEFSTLGALAPIDNTTGYLPELVIKGDKTTPEYGGGLCQVSTTLFRAALNAGLPITARRNHSFRISYYEKSADGKFIGPGLDATIYEPDLDLKFKNDTPGSVLIIGFVLGDKVTFQMYGTKDGRSSEVIGPEILTEIPAGEPVYVETDELPVGVTKQVEFPHPGGSAVATYIITYPDGHKESREFKSWYRRWPAKYLVGAVSVPASPTPVTAPTPEVVDSI